MKKSYIYNLLKKYKLISDSNLLLFNKKTRDVKKLKSYIDKKTKIIFLEKINKREIYPKSNRVFTSKGLIKVTSISDTDRNRRIRQFNRFIKNKDILDYGCGSGDFLYKTRNIAKSVTGVDVKYKNIKYLKVKKINFFKYLKQISNIKFDTIFLFHSFEHLEKPDVILKQLKSLLKKKGKLVIEVPHANDFLLQRLKIDSFINFTLWSAHLILHTKESLKTFLINAGFKKNEILFFQRYDLNNHLGWILYNKPGGHCFLKNKTTLKSRTFYNKFLIDNKSTDTLISISRKI